MNNSIYFRHLFAMVNEIAMQGNLEEAARIMRLWTSRQFDCLIEEFELDANQQMMMIPTEHDFQMIAQMSSPEMQAHLYMPLSMKRSLPSEVALFNLYAKEKVDQSDREKMAMFQVIGWIAKNTNQAMAVVTQNLEKWGKRPKTFSRPDDLTPPASHELSICARERFLFNVNVTTLLRFLCIDNQPKLMDKEIWADGADRAPALRCHQVNLPSMSVLADALLGYQAYKASASDSGSFGANSIRTCLTAICAMMHCQDRGDYQRFHSWVHILANSAGMAVNYLRSLYLVAEEGYNLVTADAINHLIKTNEGFAPVLPREQDSLVLRHASICKSLGIEPEQVELNLTEYGYDTFEAQGLGPREQAPSPPAQKTVKLKTDDTFSEVFKGPEKRTLH